MQKLLISFAITAMMYGCTQKNHAPLTSDPFLYSKTVKQLNNVVLQNNFPPMIATRNYAYANIAAYETMVAGNNNFNTLSGQIKHLPPMPKPIAGKEIDFNLAAIFSFCKVGNAVTFPEGSMMGYYDEIKSEALDNGMSKEVLNNTIAFSDAIVKEIMEWSKKDNYAESRSAEKYTVNDEEGRWVPTPPMYSQAVEPKWNTIRCLTMDSCSQFMPSRPPVFEITNKESEYFKALKEVKSIGDSLTDEQKHIAEFWDDNPFKLNVTGHVMYATKKFSPPGHWMNIVGIAAKESGADFATTVAAYTQTSIALFDAFISSWDEKFRTNLVRPETAIHKYLDADDWRPYIQTPPFPSYTSAHATNSAAAAEVMTKWFGDNLSFMDTSLLEFGIESRRIHSFREAAQEAAISRLYGGIHYRFDNVEGNKAGRRLGEYIVGKLKLEKENSIANH